MTNYLFIDGSYFCFYRYYALLTWWKNAKKDTPLDDLPINNEIFVSKFRDVFNKKISEISKKLKIKEPNIFIGKDCHRGDIWRNEHFPEYKENRKTDDLFLGGPFFKIAYSELFPNHPDIIDVLSHHRLEADDCIAVAVKHILEKDATAQIYIITSDMDYLQLENERTHIYTLKYKKLSDSKTAYDNAEKNLFCKIVTGDKSDNIPGVFKKCGIKTVEKLFSDPDMFVKRLNQENANETYKRNKLLIDFNSIPLEYSNELKRSFNHF